MQSKSWPSLDAPIMLCLVKVQLRGTLSHLLFICMPFTLNTPFPSTIGQWNIKLKRDRLRDSLSEKKNTYYQKTLENQLPVALSIRVGWAKDANSRADISTKTLALLSVVFFSFQLNGYRTSGSGIRRLLSKKKYF